MFNEGVDITSVDMVMFLRPTESPIVFLQQLGRGLRKCRGKEFLIVLDFIGNYEKAGRVRFLLSDRSNQHAGAYNPSDTSAFPDDCLVDFDMKLIDLFAEIDRKHLKLKDQIINEYFRVKELLGRRPDRMDFSHIWMMEFMKQPLLIQRIIHLRNISNFLKNWMSLIRMKSFFTKE